MSPKASPAPPIRSAIVIGAGVIGCAIARELRAHGVSVRVVERDRPGAHASGAAAGMLSPLAEADAADPLLDLLVAARARFPAFSAALLRESGLDIHYDDAGTLLLALSRDDEGELDARWRWQSEAGLAVHRLSAVAARRLEPALSPAVRMALHFPGDHRVDPRRMSAALHRAAASKGAEFILGRAVERLLIEGNAIGGVELDDGERLTADAIVLAAGCWSGRIAGLRLPPPVEPVHGQLIALSPPADGPPVAHGIDTPRVYIVPRRDGRVVVGATVERRGFETTTDASVAARLHSAAVEAIPALASSRIVESWSGLRPGTPDDRPIIGPDPEIAGLFHATGHYRNGILLAPLTAEVVAEMVMGSAPEVVEDFGLERFRADPTPTDHPAVPNISGDRG